MFMEIKYLQILMGMLKFAYIFTDYLLVLSR